jgi:hypothetical protein
MNTSDKSIFSLTLMLWINGFCYVVGKLKLCLWNLDKYNTVSISFCRYLINLTTADRLLKEQQDNVNDIHFRMNSYL